MQFRKLGYEAVDMICDYMQSVPEARVVPDVQVRNHTDTAGVGLVQVAAAAAAASRFPCVFAMAMQAYKGAAGSLKLLLCMIPPSGAPQAAEPAPSPDLAAVCLRVSPYPCATAGVPAAAAACRGPSQA